MTSIWRRVRCGERYWPAEAALRLAGLGLLAASFFVWRWDCALIAGLPAQDSTPREFLVAALAVLCLWSGLALTIEGPGLLRLYPPPPRALLR